MIVKVTYQSRIVKPRWLNKGGWLRNNYTALNIETARLGNKLFDLNKCKIKYYSILGPTVCHIHLQDKALISC